jgi:DNA-binding transcriptional regulator YhcF (GntR family)
MKKIKFRGGLPKYRQIVTSVLDQVQRDVLKTGHMLPSINDMCREYKLSRDTVLKAYNELKNKGVIASAPGKGYYIASSFTNIQKKVLVIFDELTDYKQVLLHSLTENLKDFAAHEIVFHHHNQQIFKSFLEVYQGEYSYFIIVLPLYKNVLEDLKAIAGKNVYIIDHAPAEIMKKYPGVYQDFKADIYNGLVKGEQHLRAYEKIIFLYREKSYIVSRLIDGFKAFCNDYFITGEVSDKGESCPIQKDSLYIIVDNEDLICTVKKMMEMHYEPGRDVGIISYNETPLKEIIGNGLATISTDFGKMGSTVACHLQGNKEEMVINSSRLVIRGSMLKW